MDVGDRTRLGAITAHTADVLAGQVSALRSGLPPDDCVMDDIGAEIGIAGPSIYNHFEAKTDILAGAMVRGEAWLRRGFDSAVCSADDPSVALRAVIDSYLAFAFGNPENVAVLLAEVANLPESEARRARGARGATSTIGHGWPWNFIRSCRDQRRRFGSRLLRC